MAVKKIDKPTQQSIAMMAAKGCSTTKIARESGLHFTTVSRILEQPDMKALKEDMQARLADKFEAIAESILDSVSHSDLQKATLQQKMISAACAIDKARLLNGLSTENYLVIHSQAAFAAAESWGDGHCIEVKADE